MDALQEVEDYINTFNKENNINFAIDSIRVKFKKRSKIDKLKSLGEWDKLNKNDRKIMLRLTDAQVTSAYKLRGQNIYYYNLSTPPKYDDAILVIYGMKQYHKPPPSKELVTKIVSILKTISNIDLCLDVDYVPNFDLIAQCYNLDRCILKGGKVTNTYYCNKTDITMIDKIAIYDKAYKNDLNGVLWRIEATMAIPNIKILALPLYDLKEFTDTSKGILCNIYRDAIQQKEKKRESEKKQQEKLEKYLQKMNASKMQILK